MRGIYAAYSSNGNGLEDPQSVLTPATYQKMMAAGGLEADVFDSDPVCQCQDWDNIKITSIKITPSGNNVSNAEVRFRDVGGPARIVQYRLRFNGTNWRVEDMSLLGGGMLLASLN